MSSRNWKVITPAITAILVSAAGFLNADCSDCCPKPECEECCPCTNQEIWGCEMQAYPCSPRITEHTNSRGQTVQFDTSGFYANLDVLVWKSQMDGLSPAIEQSDHGTLAFPQSRFTDAHFIEMHSSWKPGVRVGLGYYFDHDVWDVYASYTYYKGKASASENATTCNANGDLLFANWSAISGLVTQQLPVTFCALDASWDLRLSLVDVELGRRFRAGKWLVLRPFIGARGAFIRQTIDFDYLGARGGDIILTKDLFVDMKNKFDGAGLRAGLNSEWNFGCGVGLYGNAAFSILYGQFTIEQSETLEANAFGTNCCGNDILNIEDRFKSAKATIDLQLGVRWATYMCNSNNRFVVSAGWEQHLFINQNQLKRFYSIMRSEAIVPSDFSLLGTQYVQQQGDLGTEGFMISALYEF